MSDMQPEQPFVGYPRRESVEIQRLEALAVGNDRVAYFFGVLIASAGFTIHAFGSGRMTLWFVIGTWVMVGICTFDILNRWFAGLGWSRISALGLSLLASLGGPMCAWLFPHGSTAIYPMCLIAMVLPIQSKVKAELKRLGYEPTRGKLLIQQQELRAFIDRRRDQEVRPPVPSNFFSGEESTGA